MGILGWGTAVRAGLSVCLSAGVVLLVPEVSQAAGPVVTSYDARITADRDTAVHVTETITYDFGATAQKGIVRKISTRHPTLDEYTYRRTPISNVRVSSPTGAPTDTEVSPHSDWTTITVGGPSWAVSGRQTYIIDFDIKGMIVDDGKHERLFWTVGLGPHVPVGSVTITVTGPAAVGRTICMRNVANRDFCDGTIRSDGSALFTTYSPEPNFSKMESFFPLGTFSDVDPMLENTRPVRLRAGAAARDLGAALPVILGGLVLVLGLAGAVVVIRRRATGVRV